MSNRGCGIAIVLLVVTGTGAWTQSGTAPVASASTVVSVLPEPYTKEEFPSWAHGIRRFEIISLGAFPILLFYTRFAYDSSLYIQSGIDGDGFDARYAPWPFRNENSYTPTTEEQMTRIFTAAGLSLALGTIDALLVKWKQGKLSW
jgi:hypothetical protein